MSDLEHVASFLAGLALLCVGARVFIAGAAGSARVLGMSTYLIGVTVVGFGTSAPELAVNLSAALDGADAMTLGNIVGSNIANIGLILGLCAVVSPLEVHMRSLRFEGPVMVAGALLLWLLAADGRVSRFDAAVLLAAFVAFAVYLYRATGSEPREVQDEFRHAGERFAHHAKLGLWLVFGLAGLVGGAELMVRGAGALAREWGASELVIGLTIVAVGTSLPELASSLLAAVRREANIAVGNVLGSNIFNVLLILGLTALVRPLAVPPSLLTADLPVLIALSVALLVVMRSGVLITRAEGVLLLCAYVVFTLLLAVRGR